MSTRENIRLIARAPWLCFLLVLFFLCIGLYSNKMYNRRLSVIVVPIKLENLVPLNTSICLLLLFSNQFRWTISIRTFASGVARTGCKS